MTILTTDYVAELDESQLKVYVNSLSRDHTESSTGWSQVTIVYVHYIVMSKNLTNEVILIYFLFF